MADIDLFALDVNIDIQGNDAAGRTITIGQQVTNSDSINFDIPFTQYTVNGQRVAFKNEYNKAVAPVATDDAASGYEVGSIWIDTTNDKHYTLVDATVASAVWITAGAITITGTPTVGDLAIWTSATDVKAEPDLNYDGTTLTVADATNFAFNPTTGTQLGTGSGQKIAFWGVSPIIQPASADQADQGSMTSVGSNTGTSGSGLSAIGDTTAVDQGPTIENDLLAVQEDIAALDTLLTALRTALVDAGLIKGAA